MSFPPPPLDPLTSLDGLRGARLTSVVLDGPAETWLFTFGEVATLVVPCPWRLVSGGMVVVAGADHGHRFGLPAPVDAAVVVLDTIGDDPVHAVMLDEETADLRIRFARGRLEVLPDSSGYEAWSLGAADGRRWIALGGGEIAFFRAP